MCAFTCCHFANLANSNPVYLNSKDLKIYHILVLMQNDLTLATTIE